MQLAIRTPVFAEYFADPFVWCADGVFYAVGTGTTDRSVYGSGALQTADGRPGVFGLLRSENLNRWTFAGAALVSLPEDYGDSYWAPEVVQADGKWWMYYSVGFGDKGHHLRVAEASHPLGPYVDCGVRLTDPYRCPFAIDPSPFRDEDGQWYLFYAVDFLDEASGWKVGTGIVFDRMSSMTQLAGNPKTVVRARHSWQIFKRDRIIYGGRYDWHTVEGPCVRKRNGRYWCLYSAGCWNADTYGVDYATADSLSGIWTDAGNREGARLLHTHPGSLIGPGHNSIVAFGGRDHIVYHAWDPGMTARRMFIEPLSWPVEGPRCAGYPVE